MDVMEAGVLIATKHQAPVVPCQQNKPRYPLGSDLSGG